MNAYQELAQITCRGIVERLDNLGVKGKKADEAALHMIAMASHTSAHLKGPDLSKLVWIVSVRGMFEIRKIAEFGFAAEPLKTSEASGKANS